MIKGLSFFSLSKVTSILSENNVELFTMGTRRILYFVGKNLYSKENVKLPPTGILVFLLSRLHETFWSRPLFRYI